MDAVEYEKARFRMCRTNILKKGCCGVCDAYNAFRRRCGFVVDMGKSEAEDADVIKKNIAIAEKWAKDHPVKTRQSEFLKMFPNAKLDSNGVLAIRPCDIDSKCCTDDDYLSKCGTCAKDYWLTEVHDND